MAIRIRVYPQGTFNPIQNTFDLNRMDNYHRGRRRRHGQRRMMRQLMNMMFPGGFPFSPQGMGRGIFGPNMFAPVQSLVGALGGPLMLNNPSMVMPPYISTFGTPLRGFPGVPGGYIGRGDDYIRGGHYDNGRYHRGPRC